MTTECLCLPTGAAVMVLCSALMASNPASAADLVSRADLAAFRFELFDYHPQTVCALKALLGPRYQHIRDEERRAGSIGAPSALDTWTEKPASDGSVIDLRWHFQDADSRILLAGPDGTMAVGIARNHKVTVFSNNPSLKGNTPIPLALWVDSNRVTPSDVTWKVPRGSSVAFPSACRAEKMQKELHRYHAVKAGEACSLADLYMMTFSQHPHVVMPADLGRSVPYVPEPRESAAGERSAYLVAGDLVQLVEVDLKPQERNGHACAFYQASNGKQMLGWIPLADLHKVPREHDPDFDGWMGTLPKVQWPLRADYRLNFPGRYRADQEVHDVMSLGLGTDGARVITDGDNGKDAPNLDEQARFANARVLYSTQMAPAPAREPAGATEVPWFTVHRFNNAVFLWSRVYYDR